MKPHVYAIGTASAILLLLCTKCSTYTVKSDELGLVRSYGVVEESPTKPGLHFKAPWETAEAVTMAYNDLGFVDDKSDSTSVFAATKDGIVIEIPFSVAWAINPLMFTAVKTKLPDPYTYREITIVRSAVRDAVAKLTLDEVLDRQKLSESMLQQIKTNTVDYYAAQGFGAYSNEIVSYGTLNVRGVFPPDNIQSANEIELLIKKGTIGPTQPVKDYLKFIKERATTQAIKDGKANLTVVDGVAVLAALANSGPK
jgi:regulator of protease activity HflC (stomatin/prohibitin superfamily)